MCDKSKVLNDFCVVIGNERRAKKHPCTKMVIVNMQHRHYGMLKCKHECLPAVVVFIVL